LPTPGFAGHSKVGDYGDYVQMVDDAVGKVLHSLDSLGLSENTMVVFTSDNGPYWRENFVQKYDHHAAGEFRGMKGDAFEGGHRVPLIVRYPGKVKPGTISTATTTLANLMATCADLVEERSAKFKTGDSFSILPQLEGSNSDVIGQQAVVHISSKGVFAIRKGSWKLIMGLGSGGFTIPAEIKPAPGEPTGQLYNLATDIHEDNNLYQQYPVKVKELAALLETIRNQK
jgi:arylsulfatase A-like enzyme